MQNLDFCDMSAVKTRFYRIEKFENHVKNQSKIYAESMLQKVEKSMLNLIPKWAKIDQNIAPEATFGHWFCDFWPFGAMPKHHVFFVPLLRLNKNRKIGPRCGKEVPWGQRGCTRDPIFRDFGPWAPTRAKPVKSSKVLKLASWLVGTEKLAS